LESQLNLD
jgi:hypothetical protein